MPGMAHFELLRTEGGGGDDTLIRHATAYQLRLNRSLYAVASFCRSTARRFCIELCVTPPLISARRGLALPQQLCAPAAHGSERGRSIRKNPEKANYWASLLTSAKKNRIAQTCPTNVTATTSWSSQDRNVQRKSIFGVQFCEFRPEILCGDI